MEIELYMPLARQNVLAATRTIIVAFVNLIWIYAPLTLMIACSNHAASNSSVGSTLVDHAATDAKTLSKDELTKIYSQAISEYIKAVNKEYTLNFDTLFFGKHVYGQPDDFPEIELPETIAGIPIRLVTPEIGLEKQKARKSLFYINLIGFVNEETAEFIFVTFSNGCEHQYDCFINYKYNAKLKELALDHVRLENYRYKKE
jgi:hypothetical protein